MTPSHSYREDIIYGRTLRTNSRLGTIHKRRRQFFRIFVTPLPHVGSFLVPSVGNFDQFFDPVSPPNCRCRLWTAPYLFLATIILNWKEDSETYKAKLQKEQGTTPPLNLSPWIRGFRLGIVLFLVACDIGQIMYHKVSTYIHTTFLYCN